MLWRGKQYNKNIQTYEHILDSRTPFSLEPINNQNTFMGYWQLIDDGSSWLDKGYHSYAASIVLIEIQFIIDCLMFSWCCGCYEIVGLYYGEILHCQQYVNCILDSYKCDWACENRAYLHKLHMFRKWYFSGSVLKIFMFCNFYLLSYWFVNKALRFWCHSIHT